MRPLAPEEPLALGHGLPLVDRESALRTPSLRWPAAGHPGPKCLPSRGPRVSLLSCPPLFWGLLAWDVSPLAPVGRAGGVPGAPLSVPSLQTSLRQMSQTRFYVAENSVLAPHVSLFVGGLPPGLSPREYRSLLDEAVASKGAPAWTAVRWAGGAPGQGWGEARSPEGGPGAAAPRRGPPAPLSLSHLPDWFLTRGSLSSRLRPRACYSSGGFLSLLIWAPGLPCA